MPGSYLFAGLGKAIPMTYRYTCKLCGDTFRGDNKDGLVIAVQNHYVNGHGLQHGTDVKPSGIELDEEAIKEAMEEEQ